MIDCSSAYNAANVLICGEDIDLMSKVASECPCFAHLVYMSRDFDSVLMLLKSLEHTDINVYKIERGLRFERNGDSSYEHQEPNEVVNVVNHTVTDNIVFDAEAENARMVEMMSKRYYEMNARELYKLCADRGITSSCKNKKRETLIQALCDYDKEHMNSCGILLCDDTNEEQHGTKKSEKYAGLSARKLYEMCKSRGIEAPSRQPAQIYVDLLTSDDDLHEEDSVNDSDSDGNWDISY